jgi:hypothetical protein
MAITSLKSGISTRSGMAGNTLIYPGSYESIQTVTVGAGGAASVTFSSIPQTYTHLQIRAVARDSRATSPVNSSTTILNSDTGSNYAYHGLYADGSGAASANSAASQVNGILIQNATSNSPENVFAVCITDILDYASTLKNKTIRSFTGCDNNGSGRIALWSSLWMNSAAGVTSITFTPVAAATFSQYKSFALYGVN